MSGVCACCGVPGCEWSQEVRSLIDATSVCHQHNYTEHVGRDFWVTFTAGPWSPPRYDPAARDYDRDHDETAV